MIEAGDPRGEFIARQCNGDDARELLAAHRKQWLGPLAPFLHPKGSDFVNGFLTTARVRDEPAARLRTIVGDPMWSTVVAIDFVRGELGPAASIIKSPVMRALRAAHNLDSDAFAALCGSARPLPLRSISARASPFFERLDERAGDFTTAIEHARGLPELRTLVLTADSNVYHPPYLCWLIASPLAGRLDVLELKGFGGGNHEWAEVQHAAHESLGELVITSGRDPIRFRRGDNGKLTRRIDP